MIKFRLPAGSDRFRRWQEYTESDAAKALYEGGFTTELGMAPWMRVPVVGESVYLPGLPGWEFVVHSVVHFFGPEEAPEEGGVFAPYTYVVLR